MPTVLQRLMRDHENLTQLLNALDRQLTKFEDGERPDYEIIQGVVDYCLTYPDLIHHPLEDEIYKRLEQQPGMATPTHDLVAEHDELGALTRRVAAGIRHILEESEIPRDSFSSLVQDFLDRYRNHIAKEETYFFPRAEGSLTAQDWQEIENTVQNIYDPLFGEQVEDRFKNLLEDILSMDRDAG